MTLIEECILKEAAKPWADYHGDIPDYDHPLRPVYESGIQYAVELLAKVLGVEDYEICDGTEEFDGDLGGTLLNIVIKTWPTDEHGDWLDLRDPEVRAAWNTRSQEKAPLEAADTIEALVEALGNYPNPGSPEHFDAADFWPRFEEWAATSLTLLAKIGSEQ